MVAATTTQFEREIAMVRSQDFDPMAEFNSNLPISITQISQFEREVGFNLPSEYASFLLVCDGGEGFIGPNAYVIFWHLGELVEMNKAYQVDEYAPGLFLFGSDGGGEAFAFDRRQAEMPIVSVPFVGMELGLSRPMGDSFKDFIELLAKS
jgi:hypothetical protein